MFEYNDRLMAVAWWVILNSPDLSILASAIEFSTFSGHRCFVLVCVGQLSKLSAWRLQLKFCAIP